MTAVEYYLEMSSLLRSLNLSDMPPQASFDVLPPTRGAADLGGLFWALPELSSWKISSKKCGVGASQGGSGAGTAQGMPYKSQVSYKNLGYLLRVR